MLTLQKSIQLFLGEHIETTARTYYYSLRPFADFVGPARPLTAISPALVLEAMQHMRARPTLKSPASVNKHIKTLRTFFNWCVKCGFIEASPAAALKRQRQSAQVERVKAMPDHVYERLVSFAQWNPRQHALVLFLGDTGCRIGGAAGLRWSQIDFEKCEALVVEKGHPLRPVWFGEACRRALINWRAAAPMDRGDYVFSARGGRIKADNLGQFFTRTTEKARLGRWGPHSLRHRKGFQLADDKVAPTVAATALGNTISVTMEHYYPRDDERAAQAIRDLAHRPGAESASKVVDFRRKSGNS